MSLPVYVGAFGGIAIAHVMGSLLGHPMSSSAFDECFGVSLVLFLDKCIANPFWRTA